MLYKYALLKALKKVLSEPGAKYSIRGLARETKLSPSSAKACLDYMLGVGIVKLEKVGGSHQYSAGLESPLARQWKVLFTLEDIAKAGFLGKLLSGFRNTSSVILYGSAASGRDDRKSDIDILVVATARSGGRAPTSCSGREVSLLFYTQAEWREKAKNDKVFYERVLLDSIVLYGTKPVVL